MPTSRLLHWLAIRVFVVAVAVLGMWLFVSGVVPITSPAGASFPVADSVIPPPSSTELTVFPASSVAQGTAVTLSATVSHPPAAGTVQFKDGSTNVGAPVTVSHGTASQTTSMLAAGPHRLMAVFTPTDPMALRPSTSPARVLTVTGPDGNGTLPAIIPQQSGLSLDSPMPTTLDNRVPTALDSRVPTALDNRAPTAVNLRVPTILDNQAPRALDIGVPGVVDLRVPTASDNRMPSSDLDGRQQTSMASGCSATSSASCSGKRDTNRSMTSCHHSKCGKRSKCASPNAMTSGSQQQSAQPTTNQSGSMTGTTGGSTTGTTGTTGGSTTGTTGTTGGSMPGTG